MAGSTHRRTIHRACAVVAACVFLPPAVIAQTPPDERLRAALASRGLLLGADPELGSARAMAALTKHYVGIVELKECGLAEVRDTPARAAPGALNTFAVRLRGEDPCGSMPERNMCQAIRNNCLTIGTSIFCDYDYLLRLRNLARATYFYAHQGVDRDALFLPSSPELLADFGRSQMALQVQAPGEEPELSGSERGAAAYARNSSIMLEMMEFIIMGQVVGHELGHALQNACAAGTMPSGPSDPAASASAYYDLTCDERLNKRELEADLLGIGHAVGLIDMQGKLVELGYSDDMKDPKLAQMWKLRTTMGTLSLLKALEYLLVVGLDPVSGVDTVEEEPDIDDLQAMIDHYHGLGMRRARHDVETAGDSAIPRHMHPSYRAALLLQLAGMRDLYASSPDDVFHTGIRVIAYTLGHLTGISQFQCGKSLPDARASALAFVQRSVGIK